MTEIKFYNTLTKKKETFKSIKKNKVGLYTCGLTVYNFAHIGNLRTYIFEDILRRTLMLNNYQVKHVQNITDVGHLTDDADQGEDKIEKIANQEKKTAWEIADFYTQAFKQDLKKLNILYPHIWCKATEHIKEQIAVIKKIEQNGFTYLTDDGLYFDTSKLKNYGRLSNQNKDELQAGKRVDIGLKKNHTDFALWKFSKTNEKRQMEWDSPWGKGFPGWHIECSAMATNYLGVPFDIHCGGIDHIPVHHNNEIAQTEAAEGKLMANYWLHCEFLLINDDKMSKSKNNFFTLQSIIEKNYSPLAFRYLTLNTHYRQKISFTWQSLDQAQNALLKLLNFLAPYQKNGKIIAEFKNKFILALNDDLNTPKSLAVMWELVKSNKPLADIAATIFYFDKVLGLNLEKILSKVKSQKIPTEIKTLLLKREKARQEKNWELADKLRLEILNKNYLVADTNTGQKISKNITVLDLL